LRKVIFIRVFRELVALETNGNDVDEVPSGVDWLNIHE